MTTSSDSDAWTIRSGGQPSDLSGSEVSDQETATRPHSPQDERSFEAVLENELKRIFSVLKKAVQKEVEKLNERKSHSVDQRPHAQHTLGSVSSQEMRNEESLNPIPRQEFDELYQKLIESEDKTKSLQHRLSDLQAKHDRAQELKARVVELEREESQLRLKLDQSLRDRYELEVENQKLKVKVEELDTLREKDTVLLLDSEEMHRKSQKESLCWMLFGDLSRFGESIRLMAEQILHATQNDEPGAIGLGARIMALRASTPEEAPNLLKEIGEAFYRWQPRDNTPPTTTENSLVDYLTNVIANLGLKNSIELVQAGDRYDSARHFSSDRGIEVSAVRGWLVLRENGKPVTKANVILR